MTQERLAEAAYWYYVEGLGQDEVALRVGTSRSNVSRMLRAARDQGIVRFEIVYPIRRVLSLERTLADNFAQSGVRTVRVAGAALQRGELPDGQAGLLAVARSAAEWLQENLHDGQTLGLFWGSTARAMVDVAHFDMKVDAHVVQLAGEWSNNPNRSGHDLVRDLAGKLGGRYTYFNAPAFAATAQDAEALLAEPQLAASLALAHATDICLLGVGSFLSGTTEVFLQQANATAEEIAEARDKGVVGQLAGRFFDRNGAQVDLAIHRRLVSLELQDLREARTIVVVASGADKRDAVAGAIRGGLVDVLICDQPLAEALLADG